MDLIYKSKTTVSIATDDFVDLSGTAADDFGDLNMTQIGANVQIDFGGGDLLIINNQTIASLTLHQDHFLFGP